MFHGYQRNTLVPDAFFFIIASAEAGTGMTSVFFFSFFLRMS
jgi:hypothetical protein